MKDKEKQIEEMAKDLNYHTSVVEYKCEKDCYKCNYAGFDGAKCPSYVLAKSIYGAGYRKLPKDSVVLSREEYENLKLQIQEAHHKGVRIGFDLTKFKENSIEQASKETAEKIINYLQKDGWGGINYLEIYQEDLDEIAKQFSVDIKE